MKITPIFISIGILIICLCFFTQSCSSTVRTERWQDTPDRTTTKIRLITHMDKNALQYALIEKVLHARMTFDDHHSHPGHLVTKVQEFENYFVEYLVEVSDSTGTVSGDYGNLGFGALGATIITHSDVSWKPISLNSRGWIPLTIIGNLPEAKLQYNSTLN